MECRRDGCHNPLPLQRTRPFKYCSAHCRKSAWREQNQGVRYRNRVKNSRTIIGIDSETATDENGDGRLTLIAASDGSYVEGWNIDTETALEYVTTRDGELWSFFGDYDINYWLKDFSFEALNRLRLENWTRYGRWKIQHIPRRVFRVWNMETGEYSCMYDIFPFVQSSYVRWLEDWELAPENVIKRIYDMKLLRKDFASESADDIRAYTFDEVKYLARGVRVLKDRVIASGFKPSQWLGPGAVASVALRRYSVKSHYGDDETMDYLADLAYFGGRVETSLVGPYPDEVYSYDLNSAYPGAMIDLPCLACSEWEWSDEWPTDPNATALLEVAWSAPPGQRWGPFPTRPTPNHTLRYPSHGRGWFWWQEVRPWLKSGYQLALHDVATLPKNCGHKPMGFVQELYDKRRELKEQGDPSEYAYKLILNSLYGKLAQSVGTHPFRNLIWAGIITATTRGRIGEILVSNPDDVLIVATDGIYSTKPLGLRLGKRLGEWDDAGVYEWAKIWQPGFYFLSDNKVRSRGFTAHDIDINDFSDAWERANILGSVPTMRRRSLGYRLAAHRGDTSRVGRWTEEYSSVKFDPYPRRMLGTFHDGDGTDRGEYWRTTAPHMTVGESLFDLAKESAEWREMRQLAEYLDDGDPIGFYRD